MIEAGYASPSLALTGSATVAAGQRALLSPSALQDVRFFALSWAAGFVFFLAFVF